MALQQQRRQTRSHRSDSSSIMKLSPEKILSPIQQNLDQQTHPTSADSHYDSDYSDHTSTSRSSLSMQASKPVHASTEARHRGQHPNKGNQRTIRSPPKHHPEPRLRFFGLALSVLSLDIEMVVWIGLDIEMVFSLDWFRHVGSRTDTEFY
ncbi:hypothetical protein FQA39_LY04042 [Lamprigera yunnana]|nr:hypothetical protein FQA39_LY04042 [Lamprigera yunnana]